MSDTPQEQNTLGNPLIDPIAADILKQATVVPYTTNQPIFTPNNNGYEYIFNDGTDVWRYTYANGSWRKIKYDGVYVTKLIAGTHISLSPSGGTGDVTITSTVPSLSYKSGTTTHTGNSSSDTTVSHGLGTTPSVLKITAYFAFNTPTLLQCTGTFDGTNYAYISSRTEIGTGGNAYNGTNHIVDLADGSTGTISAVASMSSSQFVLTWTPTGSPGLTNDIVLLWEVYA